MNVGITIIRILFNYYYGTDSCPKANHMNTFFSVSSKVWVGKHLFCKCNKQKLCKIRIKHWIIFLTLFF